MPKTINGKPVDEEKWSKAKARAAEEGHAGDYAYIMGIYKRMTGTTKSIVDEILELLEKGRKPLPIGWRKPFKLSTGKWAWYVKVTDKKWTYDSMMTPEQIANMEDQDKARDKATKLREKSAQKVAKVLASPAATTTAQTSANAGPSAAELAKMNTREKLYWTTATDRARKLCDATGVLCLDVASEDYVEKNLQTIFALDDQQKSDVKGMDHLTPLDTDFKFLDDLNFMQDSLDNLKAFRKEMDTKAYYDQVAATLGSAKSSLVGDTVLAAKKNVDEWIEAIASNDNDKIIVDKLRSVDEMSRGLGVLSKLPTMLVRNALKDFYTSSYLQKMNETDSSGISYDVDWDEMNPHIQDVLMTLGLDKEKYELRRRSLDRDSIITLVQVALTDGGPEAIEKWFTGGQRVDFGGVVRDVPPGANSVPDTRRYMDAVPITDDKLIWKYSSFLAGAKTLRTKFKNVADTLNKFTKTDISDIKSDEVYTSLYIRDMLSHSARSYAGKGPNIVLNPDATWKDVKNLVKDISADSFLKTDTAGVLLSKAARVAELLARKGATIANGADVLDGIITSEHASLSSALRRVFPISASPVGGYYPSQSSVSSHRAELMTAHSDTGSDVYAYKSILYYPTYSRPSKRRGRAVPAQYNINARRENDGETEGLKNLFKAKFHKLSTFAERYSASDTTHTQLALATALGVNWQIRKLAKKARVVPDWQWNGFKPYDPSSPLGATPLDRYNPTWSAGQFQTAVTNAHSNSILIQMGITPKNPVRATSGKQAPEICLRENAEGVSKWQQKIEADWTHDNPALKSTGDYFPKDAVKVNKVFDILYHSYYNHWKGLEQKMGNVTYAYHGTDFSAGSKIIKGGYIVPRHAKTGRSLGDGTYTSTSSSKVCGYFLNGHWGRGGNGVMFWNRIATGKVTEDKFGAGDTVFAKGQYPRGGGYNPGARFRFDESCHRDPKSLIPIQWLDIGPNK